MGSYKMEVSDAVKHLSHKVDDLADAVSGIDGSYNNGVGRAVERLSHKVADLMVSDAREHARHDVGRAVEHMAHEVAEMAEAATENIKEKKDNTMGDIAGLLALMQGNKGMDVPGLLALCKDKGYDRGWGGDGQFIWVFFLLLLFANGGWGNLSANNKEAATQMTGNSCQSIIGLHDRISAAQAASTNGTQVLQSNLCESIASVITAVRNQGDRASDATRSVGDTVRDCCCKLEAAMASIQCGVDGLGRDIRDMGNLLSAKIELEALKQENARSAMETRLSQAQADCCCEMRQQFADLKCQISTNRLEDENARLARELEGYKNLALGNSIADAAINRIQNLNFVNYTPTRTAVPTPGTGA